MPQDRSIIRVMKQKKKKKLQSIIVANEILSLLFKKLKIFEMSQNFKKHAI